MSSLVVPESMIILPSKSPHLEEPLNFNLLLPTLIASSVMSQVKYKKKGGVARILVSHAPPTYPTIPHHTFSHYHLSSWPTITFFLFYFLSFFSLQHFFHSLILPPLHSTPPSPPSFFQQDHMKILKNF